MNRRHTGAVYEQAAGYYLEQQGFEIVEYNYRCRVGEIDIVARDGEYLVFCEVKYRKSGAGGGALAAVNRKKQQTIYRCAEYYLAERRLKKIPCRFDVIGIEEGRILHVKNAFGR